MRACQEWCDSSFCLKESVGWYVLKHLCWFSWLNKHQCSGVHRALPYLNNMVENSENLVNYSCYSNVSIRDHWKALIKVILFYFSWTVCRFLVQFSISVVHLLKMFWMCVFPSLLYLSITHWLRNIICFYVPMFLMKYLNINHTFFIHVTGSKGHLKDIRMLKCKIEFV